MIPCLAGEWPADDSTTNYTVLEEAGLEPWRSYISVRMDWNITDVAFWVADNQTRAVTKKERTLPYAGQPLFLKTWSTGDKYYMDGPPNGSHSHVLWVRSFFNSSIMTTAEHNTFDERCANAAFCLTSDINLRGSTAFGAASTVRWKQPSTNKKIRQNAGIVAGCCSSFGIFALINVILRRTPWDGLHRRRSGKESATDTLSTYIGGTQDQRDSTQATSDASSDLSLPQKGKLSARSSSGIGTPALSTGTQTPRSGYQTPLPAYETPPPWPYTDGMYRSVSLASLPRMPSPLHSTLSADAVTLKSKPFNEKDIEILDPIDEAPHHQPPAHDDRPSQRPFSDSDVLSPMSDVIEIVPAQPASHPITMTTEHGKQATVKNLPVLESKPAEVVTNVSAGEPPNPQVKLAPTKRIDYLAGLVAVACLGVTLHHFCQTFWPWIVNGYGPGAHYPKAEKWFKIFVGDYLLTQLWIGPFFLTATRFLSTNYLKVSPSPPILIPHVFASR